MRCIRILLTMICLFILLSSCGKKSDAVLIVKEDDVSIEGRVTFVAEGAGFRPNAWAPGNIRDFRVDNTVAGESGKAGVVYLINENNKLENIGKADLSKTDDELAAEYLKSGN